MVIAEKEKKEYMPDRKNCSSSTKRTVYNFTPHDIKLQFITKLWKSQVQPDKRGNNSNEITINNSYSDGKLFALKIARKHPASRYYHDRLWMVRERDRP